MGIFNSTKTRVQPLFDYLSDDVDQLNKFFSLFPGFRDRIARPVINIFYGETEIGIPPSLSILKWCIDNLDKLSIPMDYGVSKSSPSYPKRKELFANNQNIIEEAKRLLCQSRLPQKAWYIFEGYTHPDVFIETGDLILIGEAKRTEEKLTSATSWLKQRDQLIRHIDSVIDTNKKVLSFILLDPSQKEKYGLNNYENLSFFERSLFHRDKKTIKKCMDSYIGFCTWDEIEVRFGIKFPKSTEELI